MTIHKLSKELAGQIAAGEVVERPASVVKELLENAVDSGADEIILKIGRAGKTLIAVRDNGCGIAKDELHLALAPHATSKISSLEDLDSIATLGFRGEALSSIASVSHLLLTSGTKQGGGAFSIYVQGSELDPVIMPAAHPVGTSVEVKDLFFNTPGRRRFLKSDRTELSHIKNIFTGIALSQQNIRFELYVDGKKELLLDKAPDEASLLKRLSRLLSPGYLKDAVKLEAQIPSYDITGYVLPPPPVESNAVDDIRLILNGRVVEDRLLTHAVRTAFTQITGRRCSSRAVLYIKCPFSLVDVNVHPRKLEVRFHEGRIIHDFLEQSITEILKQAENDPDINALNSANLNDNEEVVAGDLAGQSSAKEQNLLHKMPGMAKAEQGSEACESSGRILAFSGEDIDLFNQTAVIANNRSCSSGLKDKNLKHHEAPLGPASFTGPSSGTNDDVLKSAGTFKDVGEKSHLKEGRAAFDLKIPSSEDFAADVNVKEPSCKTDTGALLKTVSNFDREIKRKAFFDNSTRRILSTTFDEEFLHDPAPDEPKAVFLSLISGSVALMLLGELYYLVRLDKVQILLAALHYEKTLKDDEVASFALTMPFAVKAEGSLIRALRQNKDAVRRAGFDIALKKESILLNRVPLLLKGSDLAGYSLRALHFTASAAVSIAKGECPRQLSLLLAGGRAGSFFTKEAAAKLCAYLGATLLSLLGNAVMELKMQSLVTELLSRE